MRGFFAPLKGYAAPRVRVRTEALPYRPVKGVLITLSDQGRGVPPELLRQLTQADGFEIFAQTKYTGVKRFGADGQVCGEIRFLGARIGGSLDLTGAHLTDPLNGLALDLGDAQIGGSLFLTQS